MLTPAASTQLLHKIPQQDCRLVAGTLVWQLFTTVVGPQQQQKCCPLYKVQQDCRLPEEHLCANYSPLLFTAHTIFPQQNNPIGLTLVQNLIYNANDGSPLTTKHGFALLNLHLAMFMLANLAGALNDGSLVSSANPAYMHCYRLKSSQTML